MVSFLVVSSCAALVWAEQAEPAAEAAAEESEAAEVETATPSQSLDELIATLSAPDAAARVAAVRALQERGDVSAVPRLIQLLGSDPVPEVRGWAVRALYELGTPEARSAVVTASREDPDERVRAMAAQVAGVAPASVPSPYSVAPQPQPYPQPQINASYVTQPFTGGFGFRQRRPREPGRSLRLAGWIISGVSYGLALLTGIAMMTTDDGYSSTDYVDWGWKMLLPVVGPAVAATTNSDDMETGATVVFWLWSAAQITGVVLLAAGYARRARARREAEEGEDEARSRNFGFVVAPGGPTGPAGLTMSAYW